MPIQVEWLIPNRVILSTFSGAIRLEDIQDWLVIQMKMVDEGTPIVHHISDSLQIKSIEIRLKTFQTLMKAINKSEHFGWHLEITTNPINRMTSSFASQFAGVRMRVFTNREEALRFLKDIDPSISGVSQSQA